LELAKAIISLTQRVRLHGETIVKLIETYGSHSSNHSSLPLSNIVDISYLHLFITDLYKTFGLKVIDNVKSSSIAEHALFTANEELNFLIFGILNCLAKDRVRTNLFVEKDCAYLNGRFNADLKLWIPFQYIEEYGINFTFNPYLEKCETTDFFELVWFKRLRNNYLNSLTVESGIKLGFYPFGVDDNSKLSAYAEKNVNACVHRAFERGIHLESSFDGEEVAFIEAKAFLNEYVLSGISPVFSEFKSLFGNTHVFEDDGVDVAALAS
jgi:hypothetical protein